MILRELEQAQARADESIDPPVDDAVETCPHCIALWRQFVGGSQAARSARGTGDARGRAYFLLNSWRDNPFAEAFAVAFPEHAAQRTAVPDPFFANQEDAAPVLVPMPDILLPDGLPGTFAQAGAEQWIARALTVSCRQTAQRLGVVPIGGLLVSDRPAAMLAAHLLALGMQPSPVGDATVFRYQDPAVMQLLWPVLDDAQRAAWLGPVAQWWSLRQYWQPWDLLAEPPCDATWWHAQAQPPSQPLQSPQALQARTEPLQSAVGRLLRLSAAQWHRAGFYRSAQESWMDLFIETPDVADMPDGPRMLRMLDDGAALGLVSNDALKDYIWLSWRGANGGLPVDWTADPFRARLHAALDLLRRRPGTYLSSAYHEIAQPTHTP